MSSQGVGASPDALSAFNVVWGVGGWGGLIAEEVRIMSAGSLKCKRRDCGVM